MKVLKKMYPETVEDLSPSSSLPQGHHVEIKNFLIVTLLETSLCKYHKLAYYHT